MYSGIPYVCVFVFKTRVQHTCLYVVVFVVWWLHISLATLSSYREKKTNSKSILLSKVISFRSVAFHTHNTVCILNGLLLFLSILIRNTNNNETISHVSVFHSANCH